MRKYKRIVSIIIVVIGILAFGVFKGLNPNLSRREKVEEFNYLYKLIEENYPFLEVNKSLNNVDWLGNKEKYLEEVKASKNDEEYFEVIKGIIADLNNRHSRILRTYEEFEFFRAAYSEYADDLLGGFQANTLNNEKAIERYKKEVSGNPYGVTFFDEDNAEVKDIIEGNVGYINIPQMIFGEQLDKDMEIIYEYLKEIKEYDALVIDIRENSGGSDNYWMSNLLPLIIDKTYSTTEYALFKDGDIVKEFVDLFNSTEYGIVYEDIEKLNLSELKNVPKEINDFKYFNKSEKVVKPNRKSIKFKGNIYLLVSDVVYSSSESFSVFAKDSGFATLIGEKTGGDGLASDPIFTMLPNSGYVLRFSKEMALTEDGTCNEEFKTTPHYTVEDVSIKEDFKEDECILKVLELENLQF